MHWRQRGLLLRKFFVKITRIGTAVLFAAISP